MTDDLLTEEEYEKTLALVESFRSEVYLDDTMELRLDLMLEDIAQYEQAYKQ